jgi:hypothetical protein
LPTAIEAAGTVTDLRGASFTLDTGAGEFHVNIDGKTVVEGALADGAGVRVTGLVTAQKNIHADIVTVTSSAPPSPTPTPKPGADHTPPGQGAPDPPHPTTGPPADKTVGPPDKTPGPPPRKTPAGHIKTPNDNQPDDRGNDGEQGGDGGDGDDDGDQQ